MLRRLLLPVILAAAFAPTLYAQAPAAQSRGLAFSAFGGIDGTYTGIDSYRNLSITAGGDILFRPDNRLTPSLEVRGTYPIDKGKLVGESNILAGPRVAYRLTPRFQPYADVLFGRGSLDFGTGVYGQSTGSVIFEKTNGNVLAAGAGLNVDLGANFAAKADAQTLQYATPVTTSHHIHAQAFTLGIEYTLRFGHKRR